MKKLFYITSVALLTMGMAPGDGNDRAEGNRMPQSHPVSEDWVDLGLPSGLMWAKCNLGAATPEAYGNYYAWGEKQPKAEYKWSTYGFCAVGSDGKLQILNKYNTSADYGAVDAKVVLDSVDDVAASDMGSGSRIPTYDDWRELLANTTNEWTEQNGVYGCRFTASNGNSMFLPAAGFMRDGTLMCDATNGFEWNRFGLYWSSSLGADKSVDAWILFFNHVECSYNGHPRYQGIPVRAVRSGEGQ